MTTDEYTRAILGAAAIIFVVWIATFVFSLIFRRPPSKYYAYPFGERVIDALVDALMGMAATIVLLFGYVLLRAFGLTG